MFPGWKCVRGGQEWNTVVGIKERRLVTNRRLCVHVSTDCSSHCTVSIYMCRITTEGTETITNPNETILHKQTIPHSCTIRDIELYTYTVLL